MNIVTLRDGAVAAVTTLAANETAVVTEATPRIGSLPNEAGGWSAPSDAILVDDETGEATQVSRAKWAADREAVAGSTWKDAPANAVVVGMIEQADGSFTNPPTPPKSTDPRDHPLKRWQFMAMVDLLGISDKVLVAIEALPDATARAIAKSRYLNSDTYNRGDDLFDVLGPAVGLTPAEIDAAWMQVVNSMGA